MRHAARAALLAFMAFVALSSPAAVAAQEDGASLRRRLDALALVPASDQAPDPPLRAPAPDLPASPAVEPDPPSVGAGPWILIGFGGASAVAAGVLFGWMAADFETVESASAVAWDGEVREAWERAPQLSVAGAVTASVAGLAVLAGALWLAIGPPDAGELSLGPGGLAWRVAF